MKYFRGNSERSEKWDAEEAMMVEESLLNVSVQLFHQNEAGLSDTSLGFS